MEHIELAQLPRGVQIFLKGAHDDTHVFVWVVVQRNGNEYRIPLINNDLTSENKRKFYNSRVHFVQKYKGMRWVDFLPRLLDWNKNPTYTALFNSWNDTSIQEYPELSR